jgi:hypothetical protein
MMFGDTDRYEDMAEQLLEDIDFLDILEMNNLTELEVLAFLIQEGMIKYPEL